VTVTGFEHGPFPSGNRCPCPCTTIVGLPGRIIAGAKPPADPTVAAPLVAVEFIRPGEHDQPATSVVVGYTRRELGTANTAWLS
jgi:hypothetical protein